MKRVAEEMQSRVLCVCGQHLQQARVQRAVPPTGAHRQGVGLFKKYHGLCLAPPGEKKPGFIQ